MDHVYANQAGRVVKAFDASSSGCVSAWVQSPTPGMLLHTLFLTFVSLRLPGPNYGSLSAV